MTAGHRHPEGQRARRPNPWPAAWAVACGLWGWLTWQAAHIDPLAAVLACAVAVVCGFLAGWTARAGDDGQ